MRLIDADSIDFSELKDPFDRARATLIVNGCQTVKPQDGLVLFSERLVVAKEFEKWCDECGVAKVPMSMVSFMRLHNLLIVDEVNRYAKEHREILDGQTHIKDDAE